TQRINELADLFTEDAVWDSSDNGHGRPEGRGEIQRFFSRNKEVIDRIHHLVIPLVTELSAEEARGVCTYSGQVIFRDASYVCLEAGRYNDHYVRTPDGWRFKARVLEHVFPSRRQDLDVLTSEQSLPGSTGRSNSTP